MLRFAKPPDIIFTRILDQAFSAMLKMLTDEELQEEGGQVQYCLPNVRRNFDDQTAIALLREFIKHNRDRKLWDLSDYHYLLIHDVLQHFCAVENDFAKETKKPILTIKGHKIYQLCFDDIVEDFFWDTDFIFDQEIFLQMSEEAKKAYGGNEELFGVLTGLKPHPDELKITLSEEGDFKPEWPDPLFFGPRSKCYPDIKY